MMLQREMPAEGLLRGTCVLITRARQDGTRLRDLLLEQGARVLELPVIDVVPPEDLTPLDSALDSLNAYDWIVFTSRNAVRIVFDRLGDRELPSTLQVAAVGSSTRAELSGRDLAVHCSPSHATAADLVREMIETGVAGARVLLFLGNLARPTAREGLKHAGAAVHEVVVYRTVSPQGADTGTLDAVRRGEVDIVTLASPSAARNLVDLLGDGGDILRSSALACIGPTTASAVRELGLEPAVVATDHTVPGLVRAVLSLYGGERMKTAETIGVLLMAYGTPDSLDNVEPYYTHIRGGRTPSPELVHELRERYELVGGTTPLLEITEATRSALEQELNAEGTNHFRVILGMKHWHPYIEQAVKEMAQEGIRRAVGLVLAPHYSRMSIAGYYRYVDEAQAKLGTSIEILRIDSWHLHLPYLHAVAHRIQARLQEFEPGAGVTVIFTAHSLPQKILEYGDPYPEQLRETSEVLASMLDLSRWTFSYQSAGRTPDPWLGPDLVEKVHQLADEGVKNILVASIGFVSDHLEILYDIDYEAQHAARERGIVLKRTDMLNASADFVQGLVQLVRDRAADLTVHAGMQTR